MWTVEYVYDGETIGDIFPLCDKGFTATKERNGVGQTSFNISLRRLAQWAQQHNFDIHEIFTPLRSRIVIKDDDVASIGGWLSVRPAFTFGGSPDATVQFTFTDWLGLTAGAYIIPPYSYNDHFDVVAKYQIENIVARTLSAGRKWPLTVGTSDELASVQGTIEAPKLLKDFLLERTDNETGTGNFDVYADPYGQITLHQKYGVDLSSTTTFSYPDYGSKYDIKEITFEQWDNYVSDIHLTGAGNGYEDESGAEGAAIWSTARNNNTIANTGYWQNAVAESDVSIQQTLDDKATAYVKDTDKPFVSPIIKIDGDPFIVAAHNLGGNLWLGDVINVDATGWVQPLLPLDLPATLRIDKVGLSVDSTGHCELSLKLGANDE